MDSKSKGSIKLIRDWMKARERPFRSTDISNALGLIGLERKSVRDAMRDFFRRGEVRRIAKGLYVYNRDYHKKILAPIKRKIAKAAYVSGVFNTDQIQRLTGLERVNVHAALNRLTEAGYLMKAGKQNNQVIYRVMDREKIRKELLWQ